MRGDNKQPLGRVAQKRRRVKQDILDTALAILSEQGVESLTLVAVTERLGLTKPAIYHYFRSKEDLLRVLILELLHQETLELIEAVSGCQERGRVLGELIRAFYRRYRSRLHAFRLIYCHFQLMNLRSIGFDHDTIQRDVNPLSQRLFGLVMSILSDNGKLNATPEMRQLAFSAWLAGVGLVQMLGIADASDDPLLHSDEALLTTLENVFNAAAERLQ